MKPPPRPAASPRPTAPRPTAKILPRALAPLPPDAQGQPRQGILPRALAPLLLALAACGTPAASSRDAAPGRIQATAKEAPPYKGEAGTCVLEGLPQAFYSNRDPRWGEPTAPVALVLFSDFECPYCASYRTTLEAIKTRFGPKKLQVIWKNNPLRMHPNARPAADVGQAVFESAGPGAFWRYHDLVFTNQKALSPEAPPRWAAEAGVPEERLQQALASSTPASKVEEDLELVRLLGLRGTPMTIVNGFLMEGAQGEGELAELIEEELKRAGGAPAHHACDRMRAGRTTN